MELFAELNLQQKKKRFELTYGVGDFLNQIGENEGFAKDVAALLMHCTCRRFINAVWHDHGSYFGATDVEIYHDHLFVVIGKRLIEMSLDGQDITVCESAPEEVMVCTSISLSCCHKESLENFFEMYKVFVDEQGISELRNEGMELLKNYESDGYFSPEVIEYFGLEHSEN